MPTPADSLCARPNPLSVLDARCRSHEMEDIAREDPP